MSSIKRVRKSKQVKVEVDVNDVDGSGFWSDVGSFFRKNVIPITDGMVSGIGTVASIVPGPQAQAIAAAADLGKVIRGAQGGAGFSPRLPPDPAYPLSGQDMQRLLPDARLHLFRDLRKLDSIDELLGPAGTAIILYELQPGNGHWTLVFRRNSCIECFDSLGFVPDDEIGFIPKRFREESRQENTHLLNLLANVPDRIEYNEKDLQKDAPGINTCGRWCVYRVAHRDKSIKQFQAHVKKHKIDDDEVSRIIS